MMITKFTSCNPFTTPLQHALKNIIYFSFLTFVILDLSAYASDETIQACQGGLTNVVSFKAFAKAKKEGSKKIVGEKVKEYKRFLNTQIYYTLRQNRAYNSHYIAWVTSDNLDKLASILLEHPKYKKILSWASNVQVYTGLKTYENSPLFEEISKNAYRLLHGIDSQLSWFLEYVIKNQANLSSDGTLDIFFRKVRASLYHLVYAQLWEDLGLPKNQLYQWSWYASKVDETMAEFFENEYFMAQVKFNSGALHSIDSLNSFRDVFREGIVQGESELVDDSLTNIKDVMNFLKYDIISPDMGMGKIEGTTIPGELPPL
jgi:hypothetical protein